MDVVDVAAPVGEFLGASAWQEMPAVVGDVRPADLGRAVYAREEFVRCLAARNFNEWTLRSGLASWVDERLVTAPLHERPREVWLALFAAVLDDLFAAPGIAAAVEEQILIDLADRVEMAPAFLQQLVRRVFAWAVARDLHLQMRYEVGIAGDASTDAERGRLRSHAVMRDWVDVWFRYYVRGESIATQARDILEAAGIVMDDAELRRQRRAAAKALAVVGVVAVRKLPRVGRGGR